MTGLELIQHAMDISDTAYRSFSDYSVTTLIKPVRVAQLEKRYGKDAKLPFTSRIASFMGTGVHNHVEACLSKYSVVNPKVELERALYDQFLDRHISGRFDILYDRRKMFDFKTAKSWKLIFDPDFEEWHAQQNIYAYLLHRRGIDIESTNVIVWYKDWQESNALRDKHYPQSEVCEYELTKWDYDYTEEYLLKRLQSLIDSENLDDGDLPQCTREERWERHPGGDTVQYAVLKNTKAKRASRVLPTVEEAVKYAASAKTIGSDGIIEVRYAVPKRCENWCAPCDNCDWYKSYKARKTTGSINEYIQLKDVL